MRFLPYLLFVFAAACSNGKGGGAFEEDIRLLDQNNGVTLSSAQKNTFTDLVGSLSRVDLAGRGADSGRSVDDTQAEKMRLALRNAQCSIAIVNPGKPPQSDYHYKYKFNVTGTNCPVSQVAESSILSQPANRLYGSVHVRYSVGDSAFAAYNDVTTLEFDDYMEGKIAFPRGATTIVGTGKGSGHIISQSMGRIEIKSTWAVDIANEQTKSRGGIEHVLKLTFSTFEIVLRSKQYFEGAKVRSKYFLNGNEISSEDFKRFTRYFALTDGEMYGFMD